MENRRETLALMGAAPAGAIQCCKGNAPHGIENTGGEPLLFYCAKWAAK